MALGPNQIAVVQRANAARVASIFSLLTSNWQHGRWLGQRNRYAVDCVDRIDADLQPAASGLNNGDMRNYIAASSPIHCMDGWSYLSRAIEAELSGDIDAARHLAYYAELRAAMALLASVGIGIFDKKHFTITSTPTCEVLRGPTHQIAWDALDCWADQPGASNLLLNVIRPGGKPLADWLSNFPATFGAATQGLLAKHWLSTWGLDLLRFADDREARNISSYRPTNIAPRKHHTLAQSLDFVEAFWRAQEPTGTNSFRELDRHLLRRSLAFAFQRSHPQNQSAKRAPKQFRRLVEPMLHAMMPTSGDLSDDAWRAFLSFESSPQDSLLITLAESKDGVHSPLHHLQVISRATLLLRIATGSAKNLIASIDRTDVEHLSFWWDPIGQRRGLWGDVGAPEDLFDLWLDIGESLSRIEGARATVGNSRKVLFATASKELRGLSSTERVPMWSLDL